MRQPGMEYLDSLNKQQRHAVETTEGPLLVLAGAGTGKTRVLTVRLAHIIRQEKACPSQILAVTFTNKAANEMRQRIIGIIGPQGEQMYWLGTFHRIGVRILRRHGEMCGLRRDFTILDQGDQISLLKRLLRERNIDAKRCPPRMLAGIMDGWKNRGLAPEEVPEAEARACDNMGIALYREYQRHLRENNAVDFGDLLLEPLRLFQTHPHILAEYEERFRYILVDEYQDTNIVQYLWLRLLAQKRRNLCCVGDDDQSIYSWRGAQIGNILNFNEDFPEAPVIRLERNYRSTGHILNAASKLISANGARLGKNLWTPVGEGEKLHVRAVTDSREEARCIVGDILGRQRTGKKLDDFAVLVRIGAQMRELEECFLDASIPYRVVGGLRFFERAEVRDINAYMRLIVHSDDDLAFERIVNRPRRGVGAGTLNALRSMARKRGISLLQAARLGDEAGSLALRARKGLLNFVEMLDRWRKALEDAPPATLMRRAMEESGYRQMLRESPEADAPGRLENLDELLRSVEPFETLEEYLEHVALLLDIDHSTEAGKVVLSTLHGAKGLEFDTVFLPGWEEGLFPHQRSLDEDALRGGRERLEEERRLAYVGITRAQRFACISFTVNRSMYGSWQNAAPSRFLRELPADAVTMDTAPGGKRSGYGAEHLSAHIAQQQSEQQEGEYEEDAIGEEVFFGGGSEYGDGGFGNDGYGEHGGEGAAMRPAGNIARRRDGLVSTEWKRNSPLPQTPADIMRSLAAGAAGAGTKQSSPRFRVGERVFHPKFGYGRVREMSGESASIDFEKTGAKVIIATFLEPASRAADAL